MTYLTVLRRLVEQHQFDALRQACEAADLTDPPVQVLLALALAQQDEHAAARQLLAHLPITVLDADARVDLAAVHLSLGDQSVGVSLLESAMPEVADGAVLLARLAWCRLQQGRPDEARALYRRSLAASPRIGTSLALLRLCLDGPGEPDPDLAGELLLQADEVWQAQREQWPALQRDQHDRQLGALRLAWCMAAQRYAEAQAWVEAQRGQVAEADWVRLVLIHALALASGDRHAEAEDSLRSALAEAPHSVALLQRYAELAELLGRSVQAAALWRRAVRHAEAQGEPTLPLWVSLSACLAMQAAPAARQAAQTAVDLAEALQEDQHAKAWILQWRAQAACALASVDLQAQRLVPAEAAYRAVLKDHPGFPAALQGLGQLQMQQGRIDEAVALFESLCAVDPIRGHAALISARRFPADDATLEKLERLARRPGFEGRVRCSLLLQLAAAWEHRRDFARAFALAQEGNEASRKLIRYDPKVHRQHCARIRHAFSRSLYEHRPARGIDSDVPVFVVGMPRSGTTLVEQILAGHSQVFGAGELGLVPRVVAGLDRWERHTGSARAYPDCVDDLTPEVSARIALDLLKELQELAPQARHVVDKLPHNFEHIGLIKFLFPRAKVISVRRDPRDIAISSYFTDFQAKHGGLAYTYDLGWTGEQLADHHRLMHHWHQVFPGEILEVQYEDVVADTEAAARRLLDYLGLPWEPQVLQFNELDRPVRTASVWQVRQPIYQSAKARWARYAEHLGPLIAGTNAPIEAAAITDMVSLPEPGLLDRGVALYRAQDLDGAERYCQMLLHHVPEHAAARFMVGLIAVNKGHLRDGIALMEAALARCPWNENWRRDLARAHALAGDDDKAAALAAPVADPSLAEDVRW